MPQARTSAQLVTTFDPGLPPPPQTSIDQALAQWNALGEAAQAEALLLVFDTPTERPRVFGRSTIARLIAETATPIG